MIGGRHLTRLWMVLLTIMVAVGAWSFASRGDVEAASGIDGAAGESVTLELFYGSGCPHCHAEREFLEGLQMRWPDLQVLQYEVWDDDDNLALFRERAAAAGFEAQAVPTTFVGGRVWVGWSEAIADEIEAVVTAMFDGAVVPESTMSTSTIVEVPLLGGVDVGDRSLVAATVLIGFVDGVNPCSLWVLSMLLALVLHTGSRRRVFAVGTMFLFVTSALYGLYMAGAYSALDYAGEANWVRLAVAAVAGVFGVLHIKEFFTHRGVSLTISDSHKPKMYQRMRGLARADRSLPAALGGTALLAVGVSVVETPCTAGLPLLWTDLLAQRDVTTGGAVLLFLLYISVFLLDEVILFGAAVVTLRATRLQERHGRVLQLVSGTLMLTLASVMLFAPSLLETISGTIVVFATAAAVAGTVVVVDRWWRQGHSPDSPVSLS